MIDAEGQRSIGCISQATL